MRMGDPTKLATLGRGPMKQLTTCLSAFVLETTKGSGLANLWVSMQLSSISTQYPGTLQVCFVYKAKVIAI